MKRAALLLTACALMLVMAACGRGDISANVPPQPTSVLSVPTAAPADAANADATDAVAAERGQAIFNTMLETSSGSWMCASCHSTAAVRLVGPGLGGVSTVAGERVAGEDALTYLHNSIVQPNDFIVPANPEYPANLMPANYGEVLTEDQISDLIAYLLSLSL